MAHVVSPVLVADASLLCGQVLALSLSPRRHSRAALPTGCFLRPAQLGRHLCHLGGVDPDVVGRAPGAVRVVLVTGADEEGLRPVATR